MLRAFRCQIILAKGSDDTIPAGTQARNYDAPKGAVELACKVLHESAGEKTVTERWTGFSRSWWRQAAGGGLRWRGMGRAW